MRNWRVQGGQDHHDKDNDMDADYDEEDDDVNLVHNNRVAKLIELTEKATSMEIMLKILSYESNTQI